MFLTGCGDLKQRGLYNELYVHLNILHSLQKEEIAVRMTNMPSTIGFVCMVIETVECRQHTILCDVFYENEICTINIFKKCCFLSVLKLSRGVYSGKSDCLVLPKI